MNIRKQKQLSKRIDTLAATLPKTALPKAVQKHKVEIIPVFRKRYVRFTDHPGFQSF